MAVVIERIEAHYEIQDVEMGKVYRWCPERVVVECTCGEQLTLSAFSTTCPECGADHAPIVEEVLEARPEDEGDHPWRYLQPYTPTRVARTEEQEVLGDLNALRRGAGRHESAGATGLQRPAAARVSRYDTEALRSR